MTALAILGGGGHASDVLAVIEACLQAGSCDVDPITVSDDVWERRDRFDGRGVQLVDGVFAPLSAGVFFVMGIGYPESRRAVAEQALAKGGIPLPTLQHPRTDVGSGARVAPGVVIFGQVWVSPNVCLGEHVHVSYGSTIGHDTQVGQFSSIMPGARIAGDVIIGTEVLVGTGAVILEGIEVGDGARIGAGAVVTKNVAADTTVIGIPAKEMM